MKTQHRIRLIGTLIIALIAQSGCKKDFLEISPQGSLTDALFPRSAADALLATNAVYAQMLVWQYHSGGFPILDIISDEARKGSNPGDAARLTLVDNFTYTTSLSDLAPWYDATYMAIKAANVVIESLPDIEMDDALRTRYIAEARCLRAFFYFNLVRAFGDVPIVTEVHADYLLPRSPKSDIYNEVIIPDLQFAAANLPEKAQYAAADAGRATRGAAKAMLSKVYLQTHDYSQAEAFAMEVINSGQYSLNVNFADAFSLAGQNGVESVFEIGALPFEQTTLGGNQVANTQGVRGTPNRGWGFNRPSMSLINAYEGGDVRKDATVIFLGETLDGILIQGDLTTPDTTWVDQAHTQILEIECYNQKVWVPGTGTTEQWGHNIRVMRYAEVLLIAAEAMNENGNPSGALEFLNEVRQRAGVDDVTTTDQSFLRDIILNERRLELALEGNRFFDLVRTGKAAEVLGPLGFQQGKHELFPIPQSEIDLSNGILTQNTGW